MLSLDTSILSLFQSHAVALRLSDTPGVRTVKTPPAHAGAGPTPGSAAYRWLEIIVL